MRIHKLSAGWSDKKANDIVNYFVTEREAGGFQVMESPLPMSSTVAHSQLNKQNIKAGKPRYEGDVLSVRLDLGSGRIYLPEIAEHARGLQEGGVIDSMVKAVILKAQKKCNNAKLYSDIILCLPQVTGRHSDETITYVDYIINRWYPKMLLEL